ncbi:MAG: zinc-ribbon domain-containing protein [Candidatus Hodarchaeota archaeon]
MYCTNCGTEIPDEAKFCPFCAKPTGNTTSPYFSQTESTPTPQAPYPETPYIPSKPIKNTGGVAIAVLLVVVVGIILIYFGTQTLYGSPSTGITLLVIGAVVICCIASTACGTGRRRGRSYGGGGCDCSGCDCGDCDCS